jgi:hypothetical protein
MKAQLARIERLAGFKGLVVFTCLPQFFPTHEIFHNCRLQIKENSAVRF